VQLNDTNGTVFCSDFARGNTYFRQRRRETRGAGSEPPRMQPTPETDTFWAAFRAAVPSAPATYDVVAFGNTPALKDDLLALTLAGTKRATASLLREYDHPPPAVPKVGDHVVVVDGRDRPRCVWVTVEIEIKPLIEVDDAFAWDEGEGDRSRDDWLRMHRDYFTRQAAREGFVFSDDLPVVFERFRLVWPPEHADPA
jgi:uncharacterized protein YhfF